MNEKIRAEYLESAVTDPWDNLAAEAALFERATLPALFLWRNSDCVVVGKNQRISSECDLGYLNERGIPVCRRLSGGGAVFQDEGNLNFSFLFFRPEEETLFRECVDAVFSAFRLKAVRTGRNDLCVNGKKVSGCAFRKQGEKTLLHGTFLITADLEKMRRCLTPSAEKKAAHRVPSVRARVADLAEFSPSLTVGSWRGALKAEFFARFAAVPRALPSDTERYRAALIRASVPETGASGQTRRFGWGTAEAAGGAFYSDAMEADSFRRAANAARAGKEGDLGTETEREIYRDLKHWIGGTNETI